MDETGAVGAAAGDGDSERSNALGEGSPEGRPLVGPSDPGQEDADGGGPLKDLAAEDEFFELPEDDDEGHTALPNKVEAWRRRSATGAILTGFALGLQQVFEPKQDEPAVIMETSGEPPKDLPVEADFEYGRPRQSVVNVRPWLLPTADAESATAGQPAEEAPERDGRGDEGDREA